MNTARQMHFDRLKKSLLNRKMYDHDFMELVAGFCALDPARAQSMLLNAANMLRTEGDVPLEWNAITAEVYRLSFFEEPGTYGVEPLSTVQCDQFADYLIGCADMDNAQDKAGSVFPASSNH